MLNETEAAASFHGLCHFWGRLSKASRAGMKAALRGCPKCHFPMLEGLAHTISTRGQNGAVYVSDFAREAHQPLPAISRYFERVIRRIPEEQREQLFSLTGVLLEAVEAENAEQQAKLKGENENG